MDEDDICSGPSGGGLEYACFPPDGIDVPLQNGQRVVFGLGVVIGPLADWCGAISVLGGFTVLRRVTGRRKRLGGAAWDDVGVG